MWRCFILSFFFSHSASIPRVEGIGLRWGRWGGWIEDSLAKTKWFKAVESVQEGSADNKISGKELEKKNQTVSF